MNAFQKTLVAAGAVALLPFCLPSLAYASRADRVDSDQRLQFLNQATGNSSSSTNSNSFQNRLDSIMNTTASAERTYVAAQDSEARQEANLALLEEKELEEKRLQELNPQRYNPKKVMDLTKIADNKVAEGAKYDGTEKAYEKERANIQKEFDERIKNGEKQTSGGSPGNKSAAVSALPPSLANNPFYTAKTGEDSASEYETMKPLMINRIMMHNDVFTKEQVEDYVRRASSKEELIMILMKEPGLTYSDAEDSIG